MFITPSDDISQIRYINDAYRNVIGNNFDPMIRFARFDLENRKTTLLPYEDLIAIGSLVHSGFHPMAAIAFLNEDAAEAREVFGDMRRFPADRYLFDIVKTPDNRMFAILLDDLEVADIEGILCWAVIDDKTVGIEAFKSNCAELRFHRKPDSVIEELGADHPLCAGPDSHSAH